MNYKVSRDNVLKHAAALQYNFPLIQVNESALSCFSDLRRQMFRRELISNVIWIVISNCLSQSGFGLNLSFCFVVFSDAHIDNIMFRMVLQKQHTGGEEIERN